MQCPNCKQENSDDAQFCTGCGLSFRGETGKLSSDLILENRYKIIEVLDRGGMGAVYKALDLRLDNMLVAVKEMSTRAVGEGNLDEAVTAFKTEAAMLSKLRHPNLPRISDFFSQDNNRWYLVMDYIEGENLSVLVKRRGPIPEPQVLEWTLQICNILEFLHSQTPPVIFRDLKPSNIMLTREGTIKLIDFGIARHFKPGLSADTTAYGSVGFASPEQYGERQTDIRSDIYSLGATLHYLLTGKEPAQNVFTFEPPSKHASVSPAMDRAILQAVTFDPIKRPQNVRSFLELITPEKMVSDTETLLISNSPGTELPGKKETTSSGAKQPPPVDTSIPQKKRKEKATDRMDKAIKPRKRNKILSVFLLVILLAVVWMCKDVLLSMLDYYGIKSISSSVVTTKDSDPVDKTTSAVPNLGKKIYEKEPNDKMQEAQKIKANSECTGNLLSDQDEDYYIFHLSKPGKVRVNFKHEQSDSGKWMAMVLNENNEELTNLCSGEGDVNSYSLNLRLPEGDYYVRISPYYYCNIDYTFVVEYTHEEEAFEKEINDKMQYANELEGNTAVTGNLQSDHDADYYRFALNAPGKLNVNFKHEQGDNGKWKISILDENNYKLTEFYSDASEVNLSSLFLRLPKGAYYVSVEPYYFSNIDYTLSVNVQSEEGNFEKEYNAKMQNAQTIQNNTAYTGNLNTENDQDYFLIDVSSPGSFIVNFTHLQSEQGKWRISFLNQDNQELYKFYSDSGDLNLNSESIRVPAGRYYLLIDSYYFNNSDYTFTVNYTPEG